LNHSDHDGDHREHEHCRECAYRDRHPRDGSARHAKTLRAELAFVVRPRADLLRPIIAEVTRERLRELSRSPTADEVDEPALDCVDGRARLDQRIHVRDGDQELNS